MAEETEVYSPEEPETPQEEPEQPEEQPLEPETRFPDTDNQEPETPSEPDEDAFENEELDPAAKKHIQKLLDEREAAWQKKYGSQSQITSEVKDQLDVDNFLRDNPNMSKYRKSMLNYLKHPAYKNVPVGAIAAIVSAKDQQQIGARKEREASAQAAATRNPGSSVRVTEPGTKDWIDAPKDDYNQKLKEVLGHGG